jgi:TolB-like protein/DNA-binding winged helix-turn-helix (wHTH) protein/Flp pilus assembly protein TadD
MTAPPIHCYEFGDFRLDAAKRVLLRKGAPVPLTPRVFETLLYLVQHPDTVLDKERLMEAVWPDSIVEENNLTQNISTLRRVFGETPGSHRFIVTVPGRGYRFVAEVRSTENGTEPAEKISAASDEAMQPSPSVDSQLTTSSAAIRRTRLVRLELVLALICAFLIVGVLALLIYRKSGPTKSNATPSLAARAVTVQQKSIAVLPFENLSSDPENAYFAAGIQDDLLTSLTQIHDLKVISHTSVMAYQKSLGRNMREIAQALGVANVLEGSVRRVGDRVLVSVQLIDARNDLHIWAERYDRPLADSLGLQGELATQIAAALEAQLAPEEKVSLETKPTDNPEAYALYLQARGREATLNKSRSYEIATEQLYARAFALDPKFALAQARRSIVNSHLVFDADVKSRRAEARTEAEEALRLSPSLGEAHTALGLSLFWGDKDYGAALKHFSSAAATLPSEPQLLVYIAEIYRRQGRWRESLTTFERARDLDPRGEIVATAAFSHLMVRDWPGAVAGYNRALKLAPDSAYAKIGLSYLEIFQNSNPAAGRNILQTIPPGIDPNGMVTEARWDFAMLERDYAGAERILADFGSKDFPRDGADPKTFYEGRTALARGDVESARHYFEAARPGFEEHLRNDPDDPQGHAQFGLLYAYMQRKEDALREARRALEMEPESQNAFHGASLAGNLALVCALVGEQNEAITLIERLLSTPGPVQMPDQPSNITLADLRLRWEWDSLRSNPRFQKILAGPEPKTTLTTRAQTTASIISAH